MALRTGGGDFTISIPITERHLCPCEVTGINPVSVGDINRCAELGVQVRDRVIQQLNDILGIVCEGAWILDRKLIVKSSLPQTTGPGSIPIIRVSLIRINRTIVIGIDEEIWVTAGIISNGCPGNFFPICLDSLQEHTLETGNLSGDAFSDITVTIVVFKGAIHTDVNQVFLRSDVGMAFLAGIDPDFQSVLIVAVDAAIKSTGMQEFTIVVVACILVTTTRYTAI